MNRRIFFKTALSSLAFIVLSRPEKSAAKKNIPLFSCHVAGFQYYDGPRLINSLRAGYHLTLTREPANPHDDKAIAVYTAAGRKLGYLPAYINETPAQQMDAGKRFAALVKNADPTAPPWEMLELTVVMAD
ncbi:MAG: HIRAN domain-containing protein [Pseudomonadota bacterium]